MSLVFFFSRRFGNEINKNPTYKEMSSSSLCMSIMMYACVSRVIYYITRITVKGVCPNRVCVVWKNNTTIGENRFANGMPVKIRVYILLL